jgi:hypothetical protein
VDTIRVSVAGSPATPARIVDTLRVVSVSALEAARHLLGIGLLSGESMTLLDVEGNGDGTFNLADVLRHLDRTGTSLSSAIAAATRMDSTASDSLSRRGRTPEKR